MSFDLMYKYEKLIKETYKNEKTRKSLSFKHNALSKSYQEAFMVAINELADQIIDIKYKVSNIE